MFAPPPTSQCEDCGGRAPAWSCSLPELSFPSSRRCLFCSLLIIRFAKLKALSFCTLFVLLSCVCTFCLNSRLSLCRRCLFCSHVIIHFPKQQALSFWTLFILLSCYCTLCLSGCYLFSSFLIVRFVWAAGSLFLVVICFGCCRHAQCCSFCGVRSTEALSLFFCFVLGCAFLFLYILWCFANQKVLVKRLYKAMMHCVRNNTVCMLFPFEKYHR